MNSSFDPYLQWFGIEPRQQPPNYYQLLGLKLFEADPTLIDEAIEQRVRFLQSVSAGRHVTESQRILNEIARARLCLLNAERKTEYDDSIRREHLNKANTNSLQIETVDINQKKPLKPVKKKSLASDKSRAKNKSNQRPKKTATQRGQKSKSSVSILPVIGGAAAAVAISLVIMFFLLPRSNKKDQETDGVLPDSQLIAKTVEPGFRKARVGPKVATANTTPAEWKKIEQLSVVFDAAIPKDELLLWLDAADANTIVASRNDVVEAWLDKSGKGFNLVQPKPSNRPTVNSSSAFGGKKVVNFIAWDKSYLEMINDGKFSLGKNFTIVFVSFGQKGVLLSDGIPTNSQQDGFVIRNSNILRFMKIGKNYADFIAIGNDSNKAEVRALTVRDSIPTWLANNTTSGEFRNKRNETVLIDESDIKLNVLNGDSFRIGARPDTNRQYFHGQIAEIFIFGRALEEEEEDKLRDYLNAKWFSKNP